jgi:hypothetical protein
MFVPRHGPTKSPSARSPGESSTSRLPYSEIPRAQWLYFRIDAAIAALFRNVCAPQKSLA